MLGVIVLLFGRGAREPSDLPCCGAVSVPNYTAQVADPREKDQKEVEKEIEALSV